MSGESDRGRVGFLSLPPSRLTHTASEPKTKCSWRHARESRHPHVLPAAAGSGQARQGRAHRLHAEAAHHSHRHGSPQYSLAGGYRLTCETVADPRSGEHPAQSRAERANGSMASGARSAADGVPPFPPAIVATPSGIPSRGAGTNTRSVMVRNHDFTQPVQASAPRTRAPTPSAGHVIFPISTGPPSRSP